MFELDWMVIGRTLLIGFLAYTALIFLLRVGGKRTLTQLNAFDLVITVSIGSVLATILLDRNMSIFQGITAFILLIALQWLISRLSASSKKFNNVITSRAALLYYDGDFDEDAMKEERIRKEEIIQSARQNGKASMEQVRAVILESNGTVAIIGNGDDNPEREDNLKEFL